jgi:glycosyltransferase involved in cell wall biosynthesis
MKILFLAPQPFFQDRGTPIAVRLALEVLSDRGQDEIHTLTYHEGNPVTIPGVTQSRIKVPAFIRNVRPGISLKKLLCDLIFLGTALKMVWNNRSDPYRLVHAVEESVFVAGIIRLLFGIPYIYDMDSSLALQVTERWFFLKPLYPVLELFEKVAVKYSTAVVPVCDALALIAERHGSQDTQILRDISLLDMDTDQDTIERNLRSEADIPAGETMVLYIGNLEEYQGIDLLIDSFAKALIDSPGTHLVIIGGIDRHINIYRKKALDLGIQKNVHLIGQRPVTSLSTYLHQADILVSPRTRGNNTPMKIYSYLHSGKPIIATALPTHTQVLNSKVALLVQPDIHDFADALCRIIQDRDLRDNLGEAAKSLAEERYTFSVFSRDLNSLYDRIGEKIGVAQSSSTASV